MASDTASLLSKVNVYHLTEKGLAAQATINGYKYWPDAALDPAFRECAIAGSGFS
ncbi:TPA: hypothetical protein RRW65_004346 [Klebsiella pneumoniae]|nr:hypothetical protein [Klebsiella pneumoniae]HBZ8014874.1 hypothetical protein [Klebsiella pneumoniae]HDZ1506043.1 hypothetical protein [Klebsiella pneumoniae]HDZ9029197.1 hypothetical protein [Klebsiella pneumoniae]